VVVVVIRDDGSSDLCSDENVDISFSVCICKTNSALYITVVADSDTL